MPRFGFVTIAGRSNTGKSTLLNTVAGQKVAVVSAVPQTTRHPARFVLDWNDTQMALIDLPGYAKPKSLLGKRLNEAVASWVANSDACIFLVDAAAGVGAGDVYLARTLLSTQVPVVCAVNKVDVAGEDDVARALEKMAEVSKKSEGSCGSGFVEFVPISAKTGNGIDTLLDTVAPLLPEVDRIYSGQEWLGLDDERELRNRIAEIVREKLLASVREELPYSIAVVVEDISVRGTTGVGAAMGAVDFTGARSVGGYEDSESLGSAYGAELIEISAKVLVERESQKGIVIGSRGEVLKRAGTQARLELEALLGAKVFLDLRVVVEKNWQKNPKILEKLGL